MTASQRVQARQDDLIDLESSIETSINTTNMVGEHTLDHSMEMCGQILVSMSKSNEEHTEAASKCYDTKTLNSADVLSAATVEGPVCHEPTTWLSIPNELKDMVIEQYILAVITDKSTRPKDQGCGGPNPAQLHLYPGQFADWAKQENHKLGVLRASMDLRVAATRIINNLAAEKEKEFKKIERPWSCSNPACCRYWTDAAFEKSRLLSLQAFCRGKTAWKVWAEDTE